MKLIDVTTNSAKKRTPPELPSSYKTNDAINGVDSEY
jgi:hypothetical protein